MEKWPLMNRNKVEDSNIEEPVRRLAASTDIELASKAHLVRDATLLSAGPVE